MGSFGNCFWFENSKPDATPRNLPNINCLRSMEWPARVSSREELALDYESFLEIS